MRELDPYWIDCSITDEEKELLIQRYKEILEETEKACEMLNKNNFYTWTIISGYYSMFYKALILLAEKHNLKPHSYESHTHVINALHTFYNKKKVSELLNQAYHKVSFEQLPGNLLYKGKDLRHKVNYVTHKNSIVATKKETVDFLSGIKKEFTELIINIMGE